MALRIEYLLFLVVLILLLSVIGIHPSSELAKVATQKKELEFQNFSLYEIEKEKSAYEISSKEAFYELNILYMNQGVNILRDDGLSFTSNQLKYNTKTKDITAVKSFVLEFTGTRIQGDNLALNMKNRKITADNIKAKILLEP